MSHFITLIFYLHLLVLYYINERFCDDSFFFGWFLDVFLRRSVAEKAVVSSPEAPRRKLFIAFIDVLPEMVRLTSSSSSSATSHATNACKGI